MRLLGCAKGAGMIHPNMATMLGYIVTDVAIRPKILQKALSTIVPKTFNAITVDGDTSINDTVLLMASGQSGIQLKQVRNKFARARLEVCQSLAGQIVADGEGVKHVVRLSIEEAKTRAEALRIATDALSAGAQGVCFGRNVFQRRVPQDMLRQLGQVLAAADTTPT